MTSLVAEAAQPTDAEALDAYSQVVMRVAEVLLPSVVSLRVMRKVPGGRRPRGSGSAVALTPDGYLLTSAHVVEGADALVAVLTDGREVEAELVGADPLSDLAVVRVRVDGLAPAALGDADRLRVGQLVVAVGSPLGFDGSVSAGVVSAVGRSFTAFAKQGHARVIENVIQTDAALHPGNSGGALATSETKVVGINTAVVGPGIGQGLGLAVPVNATSQQVVAALMSEGRVRRAYLGLAGGTRPLPPRVARLVGREHGVEVTSVVTGSPAARAGIRPEELIVAVDGVPVTGIRDLQRVMTAAIIDRAVALSVVREGQLLDVSVVPKELED